MQYGTNLNDDTSYFTFTANETERLRKGELVSKPTESAKGEFVIGAFVVEAPLTQRLSVAQVRSITNDGKAKFNFAVELEQVACLGDDTLDMFNSIFDDYVPLSMMASDIQYRPVGITQDGNIIVEAKFTVDDIDDAEDEFDTEADEDIKDAYPEPNENLDGH